jgi:hypothetical protein
MEHEMRHGNSRVPWGIHYAPLSVEYTFSGGYAKIPKYFELPDFLIVQDLECFLPPSLRDRSAVLSDED